MKRLIFVIVSALMLSVTAGAQPLPPPMGPLDAGLLTRAQSQGTVRVMIEFAVPTAGRTEREIDDAIKLTRLGLLANTRGGTARLVANSETWTIPYAALEVDAAALQALAAIPGVVSIGLDAVEYRHLESSLPVVNVDDAHLRGTGEGYSGLTGEGWAVAILDDGIQANHPFFGGRVVAEACFSNDVTSVDNPGTADDLLGSKSLCPNGQETQTGPGAAATTVCGSACNHGTHVAGIAAGHNDTRSGVAPGAEIIMINIMVQGRDINNNPEPGVVFTYVSDQIAGLEHIKNSLRFDHRIAAVNMSLGAGNFPTACDTGDATQQARIDAIDELTATGIAVVISSGNDGFKNSITRPGCITSAMTVSAVEDDLDVATFSNVSPMVDFFAPGVNILSSRPGSDFSTDSGTSMAAPMVAGAWAVLKQAAPNATVTEIKNVLTVTGLSITDTRVGAPPVNITKPLIQIDAAIDALHPTEDQVFNGGMEEAGEAGVPAGWVKKGGGKLKCNKETKTYTPFGDCAIMLKVDATNVSKFSQNIDSPRGIFDDQITLSAQVRAKNVVSGKLMLKIAYEQGSKTKVTLVVQDPGASYDWMLLKSNPLVLNDTVRTLKLIIKNQSTGKFFVDNVAVNLVQTPVDSD